MHAAHALSAVALLAAVGGTLVVVAGAGPASMRATQAAPPPGRAPTRQELRPAVAAAFGRESYRPGEIAELRLLEHAAPVALEVFQVGRRRAGPGCEPRGRTVGHVKRLPAEDARALRFRVAAWPTGLYFARLAAGDGRIGFAPFVVRPRPLGLHRVAVVLPTLTWQAYNLRDADGDGVGDTWYADWGRRTARLGRAYLDRGVPYNFCSYDLPFLRWLALTGKEADVLTDGDLARIASAVDLAQAYDLLVFPGHHEYVTTREYDLVERYRDLGGNLLFLSANNFFWRVVRRGDTIERTRQWRELGRPEAALIGVQYRANDDGRRRAPWIVRRGAASRWLFAGTGLQTDSAFGRGGIEIDATTPASPPGTQIVAEIPRLFGAGYTAQMTYYETPAGARVFAAGAFRLLRTADDAVATRILANLWEHLSRP